MKKYVIIAGAGISVAPPSNLPSWWEYNKKLIAQIKKGALELCPEVADILDSIDVEKKLPVQCISQLVESHGAGRSYFPLLELLNGTCPNANHYALAELARQEKLAAVVTTNYDTLIETAFRKEAIPLYTVVCEKEYYEALRIPACRLIKIHGSVHDYESLIDTVSQKAVGLSPEKRLLLDTVFTDREIVVIGFSGADLDFDLDYIPFTQALEKGSTLRWIVRPNTPPNPNVLVLQKKYPENILIQEMELAELFQSMGVDYDKIQAGLDTASVPADTDMLDRKIEELFCSEHIGSHGCIGYCLALLQMIGERDQATALAKIYESKLDWSALSIWSVLGLNALAQQKLQEQDWDGCIRCFLKVMQCHERMYELNQEMLRENQIRLTDEQQKVQELEYARNMSAVLLNVGVAYYYMALVNGADTLGNAEEMLNAAQEYLQEYPDIPVHSLVAFNLGRVRYKADGDYDQFLNTLRVAKRYAEKEGRLDALAEILLEEAKVRMTIGEYFLVKKALADSSRVLKNVGRIGLRKQWDNLRKAYDAINEKCGVEYEEAVISALQEVVDDPIRKLIVASTVQKQRRKTALLFSKLATEYMKKENWQRLEDTAQCYLDAADTDILRSDAWYMLGCALMEQSCYADAERCFEKIVNMNQNADQLKLGWAHAELCGMCLLKQNHQQAGYHFGECLRVLQEKRDKKNLADAGIACVRAFFEGGYFDEAEGCAAQLLPLIDKADAERAGEYLDQLRKEYRTADNDAQQKQTPENIATNANRLYSNGNRKLAWEQIMLAKEKYLECNNLAGVGHCENNMAGWCMEEGNPIDAVVHCKNALEIKYSLGDMDGTARELAMLLQLYVRQSELKKAEKIASYAKQNMPQFSNVAGRYVLYCAMFDYYLIIQNYASAYMYGQKVEVGINYLSNVSPAAIIGFRERYSLVKQLFEIEPEKDKQTVFEKKLQEAVRLYKSGDLRKSLKALRKLRNQCTKDPLEIGALEGTCANAYLHHGRYEDAVHHFEQTIRILTGVTGKQAKQAEEMRLTAINGMALAMWYLGQREAAVEMYRRELGREGLSFEAKCLLTVNLCNRLTMIHRDTIKKDDAVFTEIHSSLDVITVGHQLPHEMLGSVYCAYGMLYRAADDLETAKSYYLQARHEFQIVNSPNIEKVELALEKLEDV